MRYSWMRPPKMSVRRRCVLLVSPIGAGVALALDGARWAEGPVKPV